MDTTTATSPASSGGTAAMNSVLARLSGYTLLAWATARHWRNARRPQVEQAFLRQVNAVGISALPVASVLAVLLGTATVTQLITLAGTDSDLAQRILFLGLFFELAPLLSALIVVSRSSASIASELAIMALHDEFIALRRLGVSPVDYLFLPRILALAIALPVITLAFQVIAVGSGWLAVAGLQKLALGEVAGRFLDFADPLLVLAGLGKSALAGLLIGVIACYHGSHPEQPGLRDAEAVSAAALLAVGNGLIAVFAVDVAFALLFWLLR